MKKSVGWALLALIEVEILSKSRVVVIFVSVDVLAPAVEKLMQTKEL